MSAEQLAAAAGAFLPQQEAARQARQAQAADKTLTIAINGKAPAVDGKLDDWGQAQWVTIDERVTQVGDWGARGRAQAAD